MRSQAVGIADLGLAAQLPGGEPGMLAIPLPTDEEVLEEDEDPPLQLFAAPDGGLECRAGACFFPDQARPRRASGSELDQANPAAGKRLARELPPGLASLSRAQVALTGELLERGKAADIFAAQHGPTFETPPGRFRQWSLVIHLPGGSEPLSCTQGLVPLAEAHPILAAGGSFRVELRPCEGCLRGDVTGVEQITANAEGLYRATAERAAPRRRPGPCGSLGPPRKPAAARPSPRVAR